MIKIGVFKDVESTAAALEDKYWEDKKEMKHTFRELVNLIPKEDVDNPNLNGFYRVSKMDDTWVGKQDTKTRNNINSMNDIFKGRNLEYVIAEAFHRDVVNNINSELVKQVKNLLK